MWPIIVQLKLDKLWGTDIHVRPSENTSSWYRHITCKSINPPPIRIKVE